MRWCRLLGQERSRPRLGGRMHTRALATSSSQRRTTCALATYSVRLRPAASKLAASGSRKLPLILQAPSPDTSV